jgi:hypothetical protein
MTDVTEQPSTPAAAQIRLDGLVKDGDWGKRLMGGDTAATAEFHNLTRMASGIGLPEVKNEATEAAVAAFMNAAVTGDQHAVAKAVREAGGENPPTADELVNYSQRAQHVALAQDMIKDALTKFDLSPETQNEILNGCKASAEQVAAVARLQQQKLSDPEWSADLLAGKPAALREQFLMSFVLSSEQAQGGAMKAISDILGVGKGQNRNLSHAL